MNKILILLSTLIIGNSFGQREDYIVKYDCSPLTTNVRNNDNTNNLITHVRPVYNNSDYYQTPTPLANGSYNEGHFTLTTNGTLNYTANYSGYQQQQYYYYYGLNDSVLMTLVNSSSCNNENLGFYSYACERIDTLIPFSNVNLVSIQIDNGTVYPISTSTDVSIDNGRIIVTANANGTLRLRQNAPTRQSSNLLIKTTNANGTSKNLRFVEYSCGNQIQYSSCSNDSIARNLFRNYTSPVLSSFIIDGVTYPISGVTNIPFDPRFATSIDGLGNFKMKALQNLPYDIVKHLKLITTYNDTLEHTLEINPCSIPYNQYNSADSILVCGSIDSTITQFVDGTTLTHIINPNNLGYSESNAIPIAPTGTTIYMYNGLASNDSISVQVFPDGTLRVIGTIPNNFMGSLEYEGYGFVQQDGRLKTIPLEVTCNQSDNLSLNGCISDSVSGNLITNDGSLATSIQALRVNGITLPIGANGLVTTLNVMELHVQPNGDFVIKNQSEVLQYTFSNFSYITNTNDTIRVYLQQSPCAEPVGCYGTFVDIATWNLRRCANNTYSVNYSNYTPSLITGAYIDIQLDADLTFISSAQAHTNLGNGMIRFHVDTLFPWNRNNYFNFVAYVNCNVSLGQTHCVTAEIFPHRACNDTLLDTIIIIEPDTLTSDSCYFRVYSNQDNISTEYRVYEDDILGVSGTTTFNRIPRRIAYRRNPNAALHRFEANPVDHSTSVNQTPAANIITGIDATGLINIFPHSDGEPWISTYCRANIDSYDPNMKEAFPVGYEMPHYINQNVDLDYVIHFQNEGTADAIRVVVEDEIDADLDINTFIAGASSHPYTVTKNGRIIRFTFDNIHLAPKSQNEALSVGAVKFSIRQTINNPIGTLITNSAKIYFDYNTPITTNTTQHLVGKPENYSKLVSIEEVQSSIKLNVFPNPTSDVVNFATQDGTSIYELELIDLSGRILQTQTVNGASTQLNVNNLSKGVYLYNIVTEKGKSVGKIIVQ